MATVTAPPTSIIMRAPKRLPVPACRSFAVRTGLVTAGLRRPRSRVTPLIREEAKHGLITNL
jgi:hypothetical protein